MKRKLYLLLLAFVLVFSGCGKEKDTLVKDTTSKSSEQKETTDFEKPEDYTTVMLVKINPEFNLYLDAEGNTLAVEPLNDDAKSIVKDFDTTEKDYQKVINNIITSANEKGFVKEDAHISISVTENKTDEVNVDDILSNVNETATQTATSLSVAVKIETSNAVQIPSDISEPSNTTESDNSTKSIATSKPVEQSKPATTSKSAEQSKSTTTNKTKHTHTYSKATCVQPKKCSCGAIEGSALGHTWNSATCKTPKICVVCNITEGEVGKHQYSDGKCVFCDKIEIINPKNGLKEKANYFHEKAYGDGHYMLTVYQFNNFDLEIRNEPWGVYSTNKEWAESNNTITYNGKKYYPVGYGGPLPQYVLTDTEIILKFSNDLKDDPYWGNAVYKLMINSKGDLEVTYSSGHELFKKGDVLKLVE